MLNSNMIDYHTAVAYHSICVVLFALVYFVFTTMIADDFSLHDDDRFTTAQNSLYLSISTALGMSTADFEPQSVIARGIAMQHRVVILILWITCIYS